MIFVGQFKHRLDEKERLIIPAKFREALKLNQLIISKTFDHCLEIRTLTVFENFANKLSKLGEGSNEARYLMRQIMAHSAELMVDAFGRIKLPLNLLQAANINHDVIIIGNNNKIEIWDIPAWEKYQQHHKPLAEYADKFSDII